MATAASKVTEFVFEWEGRDRNGKQVRGETRAGGENQVTASLRRQGISPTKIKKRRMRAGSWRPNSGMRADVPEDPGQGPCHFHAPARHHDESRGTAAPGF